MKNKKNTFNKNNALLCIPGKNTLVKETSLDSGDLILACPTMYKPLFLKLQKIIRKKHNKTFIRKIQLDQLGVDVWALLDGKRNVKEIIKKFSNLHQLNHKEAEISVTLFLKMLGEKGLIGMREPLI